MNFKKYFLLSEEIKQPDIIDLYIMMAMPDPEDPKYRAIYDDAFKKSSNEIKLEIQNIVLRELRHAQDMADVYDDEALKSLFPNHDLDPYAIRSSLIMLRKLWSRKKELSIEEFASMTGVPWTIDSIIRAFYKLDWSYMYGGKNWAKIAEQAKNLLDAGPADIVKALDRFVDFVHNTGAVANKFKGYDAGWLNYILDIKAQSKNIRELIPYASYEVRQLFRDPAWRQAMMSSHPGLGAEESDQVIVDMFRKYVPKILKSVKYFDMWVPDMGYLKDIADDPKTADLGMAHISLLKLIDDYGMKRVVDAIKTAATTDPQIKKLVKAFTNLPNDYNYIFDNLTSKQSQFLKALGWKDIDDEDEEEIPPTSKKSKGKYVSKVPGKIDFVPSKSKPKGKLIPKKNTYWDDERGEWVQTKA